MLKFLKEGSLYRGYKPVLWSTVEKTALADAEVEYQDHKSDTIYTSFSVRSSKIKELESQARREAILDAKKKAEDYVSVLNQKVGKAISRSDNSRTNYPQPVFKTYAMAADSEGAGMNRETLAIGEIEIISTVSVVFEME